MEMFGYCSTGKSNENFRSTQTGTRLIDFPLRQVPSTICSVGSSSGHDLNRTLSRYHEPSRTRCILLSSHSKIVTTGGASPLPLEPSVATRKRCKGTKVLLSFKYEG